ncbi:MAG: T9SS type A sorting domain-containing protein [bacterium]
MKKLYTLFLFSMFVANLCGQTALTFVNNGLMPGDSSRTRDINYVDPGNPGENMVWDFSGIQFTGKNNFCGVREDATLKNAGVNKKNIVLSEDGYDYSYNSSPVSLEETGYVNKSKNLTLAYSDPILKMTYPFSYGQKFSDTYAGTAWFGETSRIDLTGVNTSTADASGTLILPDRILKNTLRVKTVKQSIQTSVCGSIQSTLTKYSWYAPGCRYPVLMLSTMENISGANQPVVTRIAWVNLTQQSYGALAVVPDPKTEVETGENSVIVFPNPFTEQVTYNYFLRKQVPVTVVLYDMSGRFNLKVEKLQVQSEGLHTGVINASVLGLKPGIYYLRFTFDKQVVVSKIVKI